MAELEYWVPPMRIPRVRDYLDEVFSFAEWFLRHQFKLPHKLCEKLLKVEPIFDKNGRHAGVSTKLYPEFLVVLLLSQGWRVGPEVDRFDWVAEAHRTPLRGVNHVFTLVKDAEPVGDQTRGYRAKIAVEIDGEVVTLRRL